MDRLYYHFVNAYERTLDRLMYGNGTWRDRLLFRPMFLLNRHWKRDYEAGRPARS